MPNDVQPGVSSGEPAPATTPTDLEGVPPSPESSRRVIQEQDEEQLDLMRELLEQEPSSSDDEPDEGDRLADGETAEGPTRRDETEPARSREPEAGGQEPQLRTFEYERRGKKVTLEVDPETWEALEAMKVTALKYPSQQARLDEAYEKLASVGMAGDVTRTTLPDQPTGADARRETIADIGRLTQQQYVERFKPLVEELSKGGYYGDDGEFAEAFPRMATTLALIEHVGIPALATLEKLAVGNATAQEEAFKNQFFTRLNEELDRVQGRGSGFEALAIPKNRERFYGYLQKLRVDADDIFNEDFLAGQFRAFNHQFYSELEKVEKQTHERRQKRSAAKAAGAQGGSHTNRTDSTKPNDGLTDQQRLMKTLLE